MARVLIDQRELVLPDERPMNVIEAARRVGIEIPHFCYHRALSVVGSCRMCLVEAGRIDAKTGQIVMRDELVPACSTMAVDGSVFVTDSPKVVAARARVEEGLLLRHPIDCPVCDKAGECLLQDYHFRYGQAERRADERPFHSRCREVGPGISLFVDRCVLCGRCVRFCREITETSELYFRARGTDEEIDVFEGVPLDNPMAGNVVDLCPVGALADRRFLYRQRVWFLESAPSVCTGCATGCSIWIESNQDQVYRITPRPNASVNPHWICDEGRYRYAHLHSPNRLVHPRRQMEEEAVEIDWGTAIAEIGAALTSTARPAVVISPFITLEEAHLACRYFRSLDPSSPLAIGPVPVVGEDLSFADGFTIRAEKGPNRRGLELLLNHWNGEPTTFERFLSGFEENEDRPTAVVVLGGYPNDWIDEPTARVLRRVELLVVSDLFESPVSKVADYVLPSAAFAERDGSYVSAPGRWQFARRAIRPPRVVRSEGQWLTRLMGETERFQADRIAEEMAETVPALKVFEQGGPWANGRFENEGIDLNLGRE